MAKTPTKIVAHWSKLIEDLDASPMSFYASVEQALDRRQIPDAKRSRVNWREGGVLSAKREYLRLRRHEHILDVCGAPFGTGFFVSYWLGEVQGCLAGLADAPVLGILFRKTTYYSVDTALMFEAAVRSAVQEIVDGLIEAQGLRKLTEAERKPVFRNFFRQ